MVGPAPARPVHPAPTVAGATEMVVAIAAAAVLASVVRKLTQSRATVITGYR
jgi:hypothetical protein